MSVRCIIPVLLFLISTCVGALEISESPNDSIRLENTTKKDLEKDKASAKRWGLALEQWQRYQTYMENGGHFFYKHLDPVFVSGLIAETDIERRQLAELYIRQEMERIRRLIAFNDEYLKAGKRLGADKQVISVAKMRTLFGNQGSHLAKDEKPRSGDRIALFLSVECGSRCENAFRNHYRELDKRYPDNVALDVYFVGNHTDAQIQSWAKHLKINRKLVEAGRVTLNHDDRYDAFGKPALPAAFLVRGREVLGEL